MIGVEKTGAFVELIYSINQKEMVQLGKRFWYDQYVELKSAWGLNR